MYVYFIEAGDAIKVGIASDVTKRLINVQVGNPHKIDLLHSLDFWICVALLGIGVMLFTLAITRLGTFSLRVGLAQENTSLRTTGIYHFSRNPMLLGLYLMAVGSAIYVQCPINWILVIIALTVHHKIILAEEVFLQSRFGEQWIRYRNNVRRYL